MRSPFPTPRPGAFGGPTALAVLGLLVAGSLVAVVAAAREADRPEGSPLGPPGAWEAVLVVGVVLAFAGYVAGALHARRSAVSGRLAAIAAAVAIQLVPLVGPLLLSTDAYSYLAYGRIAAIHEANPFAIPPDRFPDDPAVQRMGADWRDNPLVYGPAFGILAEAGAHVSGASLSRGALFHRALAALAMIAIVLLVARASSHGALGVVLVGWNPLLALHAAGGGHNDFPMMALATLGYVLVVGGRRFAGGGAWAMAIGIKFSAGLLLPLLVLQFRLWRSRAFLAGLASTLAGGAVLATVLYGTHWIDAFHGLSAIGRRTDGSLGFAPLLAGLGIPHRGILVILSGALVVGYAWLALQARRGLPRLGRGGELIALTQGWLNPWYASLYMPFVGIERDRVAQVVAVLLTGYFLLDVLPVL